MKILPSVLGMVILFLCSVSAARADLIIDLQGATGSSELSFEFSGSLTSQTNTLLGVAIDGFAPFVTSDFAFSLLTPPAELEIVRGGSTVGTTNVTHIRSFASGTGIILEIGPDQGVQANDQFLFSGSGTFTLPGGQTFDNFTTGSYAGTPEAGFLGAVTLNISQVAAVPEPSSLWLLIAAGGSMGLLRSRVRTQTRADR
ncbi:MAG: PEP-CTERM sorting domain-containing protein [Pirellulaceae bacterium]